MGKRGESPIHSWYSDWHWNLTRIKPEYKTLYVSDIDRIWIEYDLRGNEMIGVFDLKVKGFYDRAISPTEKAIYDWFLKQGVKVYIVYIKMKEKVFQVINYKTGEEKILEDLEYADFLLQIRRSEDKSRKEENPFLPFKEKG